jgi:hypothetical protein
MIHTDDSCIPTAPAPQIFGASDDLLHQLQKQIWSWSSPKQPLIMVIHVGILCSWAILIRQIYRLPEYQLQQFGNAPNG